MPIAPTGTNQVHLADGTITAANETAVSVAMMTYAMKHKRDYKSLTALGFSFGSHGQSVAMLSVSDKRVNHGNVATYDWPVAPLPELTYPYAHHQQANEAEE